MLTPAQLIALQATSRSARIALQNAQEAWRAYESNNSLTPGSVIVDQVHEASIRAFEKDVTALQQAYSLTTSELLVARGQREEMLAAQPLVQGTGISENSYIAAYEAYASALPNGIPRADEQSAFQSFVAGLVSSVPGGRFKNVYNVRSLQAITEYPAGAGHTQYPYQPQVVGPLTPRPLGFAFEAFEALNPTTASFPFFRFLREKASSTYDIAVVPELALKPESKPEMESVDYRFDTIASWIDLSTQALAAGPDVLPIISTLMERRFRHALNGHIISGGGASSTWKGIGDATNSVLYTGTGSPDTFFDSLFKAMMVATELEATPSQILVNPALYQEASLLKDAELRYIASNPLASVGSLTLWGVPAYMDARIPVKNAWLTDIGGQIAGYVRDGVSMQLSTENKDNFIRNMVTVRWEIELAIAALRQAATVRLVMP